jgi:hypothetical protein
LARALVEEAARSALTGLTGVTGPAASGDAASGGLTGPRKLTGPGKLTWARTDAGRPYLVELPEFWFSIAHAGPYVGVALAGVACGLDLEIAGRAVNPALARRFAPDERAFVEAAAPGARGRRLLEVWTKKEAYLKWSGRGIAGGLGGFSTLDPAALGVGFLPLAGGPRRDLIGWVCLEAAAARRASLRQEWLAPSL